MKALVGAFNQGKALVGAFSVIVQPVVEPMDRFTALVVVSGNMCPGCGGTAPTTTTAAAAVVLSPAGQGQSAVSGVRHRLGFPASKYQGIYTIRQPDMCRQ